MSQIVALTIANTEPDWIKNLKFGDVPKMIDHDPKAFDVTALTDDGCILVFERKTAMDFLNTLKEERLFPQLARMTEQRNAQARAGALLTHWAHLIITGQFLPKGRKEVVADGKVREWSLASIQGTLLSIQEMGIFVTFCDGDMDYENTIIRIGKRSRDPETKILAPRPAKVLGPEADFLAGIQGVEIANSQKIMEWCGNNLGHGLAGLTDLSIPAPIPLATRKRFRKLLRLQDCESLEIVGTQLEEIAQGEKTHAEIP